MRIRFKDGTGSMNLKYLSEEWDRHGNLRLYVRRRGRRVRLRHEPGTEAFLAEYRSALAGSNKAPVAPQSSPGTLRWLSIEYFASGDFRRLDPATQTIRRRIIEAILPKWGTGKIREMRPKHVRLIRDEKTGTPHAANNLLKALRVMFKWAIEADHMDRNPARDVARIQIASDGHHTWTLDEMRRFMERHPPSTKAGLAFALLYHFMVRRSDVVRLGRQMEAADGKTLRLTETKGRNQRVKVLELPIEEDARRVLDLHKGRLTYLTTQYGKPFTANGFGNWFKKRCIEAGLPHCSAHGIRKGAATDAAEQGATTFQIMGMGNWSSPKDAEPYVKKASRKKLAADGAKFLSLKRS